MSYPSASAPPLLWLPCVERTRKVRVFLHITPRPCKKGVYLSGLDLRCHLTPGGKSLELARRNHSNMASAPSSSSRPHGSEKGDWERCSISHSQLVKLQTQGFLTPADLVPIRAGLTSFNGGAQAENFPNPSRGNECASFPTC